MNLKEVRAFHFREIKIVQWMPYVFMYLLFGDIGFNFKTVTILAGLLKKGKLFNSMSQCL